MLGPIIGVVVALLAFGLAAKGFSPAGLPVTNKVIVRGKAGKILGVVCLVIGALFLLGAAFQVFVSLTYR